MAQFSRALRRAEAHHAGDRTVGRSQGIATSSGRTVSTHKHFGKNHSTRCLTALPGILLGQSTCTGCWHVLFLHTQAVDKLAVNEWSLRKMSLLPVFVCKPCEFLDLPHWWDRNTSDTDMSVSTGNWIHSCWVRTPVSVKLFWNFTSAVSSAWRPLMLRSLQQSPYYDTHCPFWDGNMPKHRIKIRNKHSETMKQTDLSG